jgi:hypothetical protein
MSYYNFFGGKAIIFTVIACFLVFVFSMIAFAASPQEGFGPKWIRTNKNSLFRKFRRTIKPRYDMLFEKIHQFRRKWF